VIGAGAWGTALAIALSRDSRHNIRLWAHEAEVRESIAARRINELFLPGKTIPPTVRATNDYREAADGADILVSVMPSHHCRAVFEQLQEHLTPEMPIVSATKGLEASTLMRMSQVITQVVETSASFTPRVGALSGPSFAAEVARGDPTAITIASQDAA